MKLKTKKIAKFEGALKTKKKEEQGSQITPEVALSGEIKDPLKDVIHEHERCHSSSQKTRKYSSKLKQKPQILPQNRQIEPRNSFPDKTRAEKDHASSINRYLSKVLSLEDSNPSEEKLQFHETLSKSELNQKSKLVLSIILINKIECLNYLKRKLQIKFDKMESCVRNKLQRAIQQNNLTQQNNSHQKLNSIQSFKALAADIQAICEENEVIPLAQLNTIIQQLFKGKQSKNCLTVNGLKAIQKDKIEELADIESILRKFKVELDGDVPEQSPRTENNPVSLLPGIEVIEIRLRVCSMTESEDFYHQDPLGDGFL